MDCERLSGPNTTFWPISTDGHVVGKVTSAVYSPRLYQNIAIAMVSVKHTKLGTVLDVETTISSVKATVVSIPFYDLKKSIAKSS